MGKKGITQEQFKQVKQLIKDKKYETLGDVAKVAGLSYATVSKIKNSSSFKVYKEKYCSVKTPQEKLEEFLKNPNTDESLEKLVESFLEDKRPVKKQKISFWEKLKRHFNR